MAKNLRPILPHGFKKGPGLSLGAGAGLKLLIGPDYPAHQPHAIIIGARLIKSRPIMIKR
jgi:hypothetical protein